jgi:hypothetical protein
LVLHQSALPLPLSFSFSRVLQELFVLVIFGCPSVSYLPSAHHKMNFERIGAAVSAIWVTIVSVFTRTKSAPWKGRDVFFVIPKRGRIKSVID